ncbi:MAG: hypothetical protein ACJASZ_001516 [Yoonia sp.]|jgi:hypothetical protein
MPYKCEAFVERWAFGLDANGPQPQRDHRYTDPDYLCENPKWCMVPGGWADRFALAVHRPAGPIFGFTRRNLVQYWHFRATTTGWKTARFETGSFRNTGCCTCSRAATPSTPIQ